MKIIQYGKLPEKVVMTKRFRCGKCGCIFEATEGEYFFVTPYQGCSREFESSATKPRCPCPTCGSIVVGEMIMR